MKNVKNKMMYEDIKRQNLGVLKLFLSADVQFKKNFIDKENGIYKKKADEDITLERYKKFIESLRVLLHMENYEFETINEEIIIKHLKNSEVGNKEIKAIFGINTNPKEAKLKGEHISLKEGKDFILFIIFYPTYGVNGIKQDQEMTNSNTNHIYKEIQHLRSFFLGSLCSFNKIGKDDLVLFKMFIANLEKLSGKLYKKCYYYGTPKSTKPGLNPKKENKKEEGKGK